MEEDYKTKQKVEVTESEKVEITQAGRDVIKTDIHHHHYEKLPTKNPLQFPLPPNLHNQTPPEPNFVGRVEMRETITQWYQDPKVRIGALIGWGGVGKSALVRKWYDCLSENNIQPDGIFWWGFYRNPYLERFLEELLKYLAQGRIDLAEIKTTWQRVERIKEFILQGEYLLILDGLEEMQKGEKGEEFGCVQHRELSELLKVIADANTKGLCLITTRYPLKDIENYKGKAYQTQEVEQLELEDSMLLFAKVGVKGEQSKIDKVIKDYDGHALSLTLLSKYLVEDYGGNIKQAGKIPPFHSDKEAGGKAHRILLWYEKQLTEEQKAFMKIFSLFRRAVQEEDFEGVFRAEMETQMNQPLRAMSEFSFNRMKDNLCERRLISRGQESKAKALHSSTAVDSGAMEYKPLGLSTHQDNTYTTHPLIKNYFESVFEEQDKKLCHKRLYQYFFREIIERTLDKNYQLSPKYIPPRIKTDAGDDDAHGFLQKWLNQESSPSPFCAILGDLGLGKTFLCRMFAKNLLDKIKAGEKLPFPLYLDLNYLYLSKDKPIPSLEEIIEETLKAQGVVGIDGKKVLEFVHSGEILLLIDSINEKTVGFTPNRAFYFWQQIRRAVTSQISIKDEYLPEPRARLPEVVLSRFSGKVILACRTHYFRNMEDAYDQLTGGRKAGFREEDFQIAFLNSFTEKQILDYLRICFDKKAEEFWQTLKGIYNIPDLAKRPFLLSFIEEYTLEIIKLKKESKELTSASLYELMVKEWIMRDWRSHQLPAYIKAELMEDFALNLWQKQIQSEEITKIDRWVKENILPKFSGISFEVLEEFNTDIRTATFLNWSEAENERGKGFFRFQHRSFQEFFIARRIARGLSCGDSVPLNIPPISTETAEFVLGILKIGGQREYNKDVAQRTIEGILGSLYLPQVSENSLILLLKWRELSPQSYPLPQRFCLSGADISGFVFDEIKLE